MHPIEENLSMTTKPMTTKHSTKNSTNNRTKRSSYLFLPARDASSQDKAFEASGVFRSENLSGFTLVELMVAMCVSLMLLGGVVSLFGTLGESVNDSKSNSEMLQSMRHTAKQLQADLGNVSVVPDPAQTALNPQGFFEYVEGPLNDKVPYSDEPEEIQLPDPVLMDVGSAQATNGWNFNGSVRKWCYANNNLRTYNNSMGNKSVTWTKTGLQNGKYRVSLTWPTEWLVGGQPVGHTEKHWWDVPVTIASGDNSQTVSVDQTQIPSDLADPEETRERDGTPIMWHHLGELDVTDGEIMVQLGPYTKQPGDPNSKHVYADAIRIECLELTGGGATDDDQVVSMSLSGDCDDVLHFTTKTDEGAHEVVWFLTPMAGHENKSVADRRYRLHRRELKVDPHLPTTTESLSLGWVNSKADGDTTDPERAANSLEALSLRYNRNAHAYSETGQFELNTTAHYKTNLESEFIGNDGVDRTGKTVILENVIAFDVQAYDPKVPIYSTSTSDGQTVSLLPTDPGYTTFANSGAASIGNGAFRDLGTSSLNLTDSQTSFQKNSDSPLILSDATGSTYDSWSGDYVKNGDVGFDNDADNIVDTAEDLRQSPPYDAPLKAVQVEIRMQEPESGKVRSVKVRKYLGKR